MGWRGHAPLRDASSPGLVAVRESFHFDLVSGLEMIRDEVGVEADGPEQAVEQAQAVIADMRESGELTGNEGSWTMVVRGAAGGVVRRVPIG